MARLKNATYTKNDLDIRREPIDRDSPEAPSDNKGNNNLGSSKPKNLVLRDNIEAPSNNKGNKLLKSKEPNIVGKALEKLHEVTTNPKVMELSLGPLNKLQRAKIFLRRKRPMERIANPRPLSTKVRETTITNKAKKDEARSRMAPLEHSNSDVTTKELKQSKANVKVEDQVQKEVKSPTTTDIKNKVTLINISASPYIKLELQGLPMEVEFNPETTWSTVKSMGRNNPFYVYTGGEDTLSFEVTWYANDPNGREDVINKCKLLESWSKADSYTKSPPLIQILWGSSGIFSEDTYILHQAKYKLSNFQNAHRSKDRKSIIDGKLLPNTAIQNLVFKKVTSDNQTSEQIISTERINNTKGISR